MAAYLSHWLGRHADGMQRAHGQHFGEPGSAHPIGMAPAGDALEVHGIGEKDPIDVRRKHIVHFKGASGYLEGHPTGAIQLGEAVAPTRQGYWGSGSAVLCVGEQPPASTHSVDIPGMQIQADVPRYHGLPPFASILERRRVFTRN